MNWAAVAPENTRWSTDSVMRMTLPGTMRPSSTTGTSLIAPTARIADSGGLMIATNSSTPNIPRFEMEKVAPLKSPSAGRPDRARSMTCRDSIEIWMMSLTSASWTTGTRSPMPWLGATARPMLTECLRRKRPSTHDVLTSGNFRRASAHARTRKSVIVTLSAPGTESLSCWRMLTAWSTRASTVTVKSGTVAFADPVIEVQAAGMPRVHYGCMTPNLAPQFLAEHFVAHRLLDDHVIATRRRGLVFDAPVTHILVCDTGDGVGNKTEFFQFSFQEELKRRGLADRVQVVRALDMGIYNQGGVVQLLPAAVTYTHVLAPDVARIVAESVTAGRVLDDLLCKTPDKQVRIGLRHCGQVDPDSADDYLRRADGYQAIAKALFTLTPEQVIAEMKISALRGRGGAGFPTWMKWQVTRPPTATQHYVSCNGDEGDPGAFMDRSVLESDPHAVLEGMMIAAYAMGASQGYFYIRAEYPKAVERVQRALEQARELGLLGRNILGSGFNFDAKIRLGAGAFVCGEETALIASIEGRRGSPSPRPPYPSVRGLWGMPTAINNVETLAIVPAILLNGGAWFASHGTATSKGTKVFAVTGKVRNAQLVEVPMGTSTSWALRTLPV